MQHIRQLVSDDFDAVNSMIIDQLHSRVGMVENIGHYIIDAGGKRLRPLLALLAANACGCNNRDHIRWAAIIEFIHTATLLHDDVVDLSTLRRGRPTANANWGNAPSVLVGDFIYSRAFQMLAKLENPAIVHLLADTTNQIAEGEVLQLTKAGDPDTTLNEYLQVIRDKTAILFAAALKGSAIIAGAEPRIQDALHAYGLNLGIAFQLADDALDYEGEVETMGKNVGDDLAEGKPTLPLIHAIANARADEAAIIIEAIRQKSASSIDAILVLVKRNGSLDYTRNFAQTYATSAKQCLQEVPPSRFREALEQLADFSVTRSF